MGSNWYSVKKLKEGSKMRHSVFGNPKESDSLFQLLKVRKNRYYIVPGIVSGLVLTGLLGGVFSLVGLPIVANLLPLACFCCSTSIIMGMLFYSLMYQKEKKAQAILAKHEVVLQRIYPELQIQEKQLAKAVVTQPKKTALGSVNYAYFLDQEQKIRVIRETTSKQHRSTGMVVLNEKQAQPYLGNVQKRETPHGPQLVLKRN